MAKQNYLESIYDSSPDKIFDFVEEQLFQNEKNVAKNDRKITTMFVGSPGIGKTEVLENFPLRRLEKINSQIAEDFGIKGISLSYNKFENIKDQTEKALSQYNISPKDLKEILDNILLQPDTEVVMVSQSDIIVPEDISGLPSSQSEFSMLKDLYDIASIQKDLGAKEDPELKGYRDKLTEKVKFVLKQNTKDADDSGVDTESVVDRNTTKFDFTEWEKKVHHISVNKLHIKHILLVLDDITRTANGSTGILQVLMPIFQQYTVGQRPLPLNCSVIVTSNEEQDESGEINYVTKLDQAQKDRLFAIKVAFNLKSWVNYARTVNVHESAILFAENSPKIFSQFWITPRRYTQFGQSIFNKFGDSGEIFSDNVEKNAELLKTIRLQLGDSNNEQYKKLITEFISFLRDTGSEAFNFIEALRKNGYTTAVKNQITGLRNAGRTVTMNIIAHKIKDIITKTVIDKSFRDSIIKLFGDNDVLPENITFSMVEIYLKMNEDHKNLKSGNKSTEQDKKIYAQLGTILANIAPNLRNLGSKLQDDFKKNKADFEK